MMTSAKPAQRPGFKAEPLPGEPLPIRMFRRFMTALFRLCFRIEYYGQENVPLAGPCLLVPNHRTFFDPLFIGLGIRPLARYMAWDRLFRNPLIGRFLQRMGAFPVDVTRPDKSAYKQCLKVLRQGGHLVVFPEGARTKRYPLEEFKNGVVRMALATGAPLVPCTILGGERVWPATRRIPRPGKVRVIFHPPIPVPVEKLGEAEAEKARIAELLNHLRSQVLAPLVNEPTKNTNEAK